MKIALSHKERKGFTLTETVIAIGVVALLLTSFIAVFGPARNQIQNVIAREEADRLLESLEAELRTLRPNEVSQYPGGSFEKAFRWIEDSHEDNGAIFLYNYRADPVSPVTRPDDSLDPIEDTAAISGQEVITLPAVRRISDTLYEQDAAAIQGRVYYVKLTQLVVQNGEMVEGQPGAVSDPRTGTPVSNAADYPEAAIALRVDFFVLPTKRFEYTQNAFDPATFTTPVFSRNIAIRR